MKKKIFLNNNTKLTYNLGTVISRMYSENIKSFEKYCLRLLLLRVKGAQSFEDVRTFEGITHDTFEAAARAHKLIESDEHILNCLNEAVFLKMPKQLRNLFATIIMYNRIRI